jgi:hypothetical protein
MTVRKYLVTFSSGRSKIVEAFDARDAISQQILWARQVLGDQTERIIAVTPAPKASLVSDLADNANGANRRPDPAPNTTKH